MTKKPGSFSLQLIRKSEAIHWLSLANRYYRKRASFVPLDNRIFDFLIQFSFEFSVTFQMKAIERNYLVVLFIMPCKVDL